MQFQIQLDNAQNTEDMADVMTEVLKQLSNRPAESLTPIEAALLAQIKQQIQKGAEVRGSMEEDDEEEEEIKPKKQRIIK